MSAKIICLEGLDSSGKSTQVKLITKYLEDHGLKYQFVHFPTYTATEAGKVVSSFLRGEFGNIDEVNPIFVANIYAMDRYLYLPEINKMLEENDVLLLDRYVFSNMAYQGAKTATDTQAKLMRDWIFNFEFGFLELPYPSLTVFFDVPIEIIKERLEAERIGFDRDYLNGQPDIHEQSIDFQSKVRDNYLALEGYVGYKIIPTETLTPEEIFDKYEKHLFFALVKG